MPPETDMELDVPRTTDYLFSELFGEAISEVITFPFDDLVIQNQSLSPRTRFACTRFGLTHISNGNSILDGYPGDLAASKMWEDYLVGDPTAMNRGATLQSALDQFRKEGIISGYSRIFTIDDAKTAIDNGQFVYTGSKEGDWDMVKKEHVYGTKKGSYGHVFCIVGYSSAGFVAINSYGQENGYFDIPYELFGTLFSKYAIVSQKYQDIISNHKAKMDETYMKKTVDSGLMSSDRPDDSVTRKEMSIIIGRLLEMLGK